jgi:integrase
MPKLTKRTIDALPQPERDTIVWDDELPGFGIRLKPSGSKSYVVQYRNRECRTRRLTIGAYTELTPTQARKEGRQKLADAARGGDPSEERHQERRVPTVKEFAERYLEQHAIPKKKPSSVATDRGMLKNYIVPQLGHRKMSEIGLAEVADLHHAMRRTPSQANRVLALLSKMISLAERWGVRPFHSNPCRYVDRYPENRCERFLSGEELGRLGEALAEVEASEEEHPSAILAIRLVALTGARKGEIQRLRWKEVDFERGCLRLEDSKTGRKAFPLGAPALQLLAQAPREEGNPYVCFGVGTGSHFKGLHRVWDRVRKAAGLEDVRLHDLRHTHASFGAAAGLGLPVIGRLLGHKSPATTARYAHLADDPLRAAAERVAGEIAARMFRMAAGEVEGEGLRASAAEQVFRQGGRTS